MWMIFKTRPRSRWLYFTTVAACFFVFVLGLNFTELKTRWTYSANMLKSGEHHVTPVYRPNEHPVYEPVMDCITKEQRRAGIVGHLKTIEFTQVVQIEVGGENRNQSQESFRKIFKDKVWINDTANPQAASGPGSSLEFAADAMAGLHVVITELKSLLRVPSIRMLDIPCGDMVWMSRFLESREDVNYTGIDIVPDIISVHQKKYADKPWTFIHRDIITQGVGAQYDLIFNRQMLQHLLTGDVIRFLQQISRNGGRYLLTTSFPGINQNSDVHLSSYRFRPLNLEAPPINLAPPLCFFRDGPTPRQEHSLMLYELPLRQVVGCTEAKPMKIISSLSKQNTYYSCGNWSV